MVISMKCDLDLGECRYYENGKCFFHETDIPKTIAVDLDNTIFRLDKWRGQNYFGEKIDGVKENLKKLKEMGFEIIIWTTRFNEEEPKLEDISDLLEKKEIPFDYINENPYQPPDMSQKIYADYYVDDRAIEFKGNWDEVIKKIKEKERESDIK